MAFRSDSLRLVFEGQGEQGFAVWTYGSSDRLGDVVHPGLFGRAARALRAGDFVHVGLSHLPPGKPYESQEHILRRVILMVATTGGKDQVTTRLVQDLGGREDGDAPVAGAATPTLPQASEPTALPQAQWQLRRTE